MNYQIWCLCYLSQPSPLSITQTPVSLIHDIACSTSSKNCFLSIDQFLFGATSCNTCIYITQHHNLLSSLVYLFYLHSSLQVKSTEYTTFQHPICTINPWLRIGFAESLLKIISCFLSAMFSLYTAACSKCYLISPYSVTPWLGGPSLNTPTLWSLDAVTKYSS